MKRSALCNLSAASPTELMLGLLFSPRGMLAARHSALCNDLALGAESLAWQAGKSRFELLVKQAMADEDGDEEEWVAPWEEPIYEVQDGIATVRIEGPLLKGYDAFTCWWYGYFCMDRLTCAIDELAARADVSLVAFVFNSPGGVCTGIHETGLQIAQLGKTKLTLAYTETMCCSAAYWLAVNCHAFYGALSADIGSIGVYMALYDYSAYLAQLGIKLELIRKGRLKGIGVMGKKLTKEELDFLDADCTRVNDRFRATVLANRGEVADDTMQGQWFDGEEATARNLIDGVSPSLKACLGSIRTAATSFASAAI